MRRATRQRLWLVALALPLAVLSSFALWRAPPQPARTLLPFPAAAVTRIEVSAQGGAVRHFEKRQGVWWMTTPHQAKADAEHLARLAEVAEAEVLRWRARADFDAARIGLEAPFARLRLNDSELVFGGISALAMQRYVGVGDQVALVVAAFGKDLAALPEAELAAP